MVGIMEGFDQLTNVILSHSHERIFSRERGVQINQLGLYMIRGDNVAICGPIEESLDGEVDWEAVRVAPLSPVIH